MVEVARRVAAYGVVNTYLFDFSSRMIVFGFCIIAVAASVWFSL